VTGGEPTLEEKLADIAYYQWDGDSADDLVPVVQKQTMVSLLSIFNDAAQVIIQSPSSLISRISN
jgi:ribosomal protein L30E